MTQEDKNIVDKAKDVAETLKDKVTTFVDEHQDEIDKAKDKTKEVAETVKEKVTAFVGDHEDQIDSAIDKTSEFVDDKTKGRYSEKIDKAQEKAKGAVSKLAGDGGDGDGDAAADADTTPELPASASSPEPTPPSAPDTAGEGDDTPST